MLETVHVAPGVAVWEQGEGAHTLTPGVALTQSEVTSWRISEAVSHALIISEAAVHGYTYRPLHTHWLQLTKLVHLEQSLPVLSLIVVLTSSLDNLDVSTVPECFLRTTTHRLVSSGAGAPGVASDPGPLQSTPGAGHSCWQLHLHMDSSCLLVRCLQSVLVSLMMKICHINSIENIAIVDQVTVINIINMNHWPHWFIVT